MGACESKSHKIRVAKLKKVNQIVRSMVRSTRVGAGKVEFRMTQIQYIDVLGCDQHQDDICRSPVQTRVQSELI